jgi:HNH endonuclease
MHHQRLLRHGTTKARPPTLRERVLGKTVIRPNGCVEWTGGTFQSGYGRISVNAKGRRVHRVVYELLVGPIPEGLTLDHLCRNLICCAPAHLEPVADRENILRGEAPPAVNARKTHCPQGHPYSVGNTCRDKHGKRSCRKCAVAATQRYYARNGGQRKSGRYRK